MSFNSLGNNNSNKANCSNCCTCNSNPIHWSIFEGCFSLNSSIMSSFFNLFSDLLNFFSCSLDWRFIWFSIIEFRDSIIRIYNMINFFLCSLHTIFNLFSYLCGHFLSLLSNLLSWVLNLLSDFGCFLLDNLNCLMDLFSNITHIKN